MGTRVSGEAPVAGVGIGAAPLQGGPDLEVSCTCVCPSLLWGLVAFSLVPRLDLPGGVVQGHSPNPTRTRLSCCLLGGPDSCLRWLDGPWAMA